jgi:hypothetical protein
LAIYLFKTFVWPGARVTYTGEPFRPVDPPTEDFLAFMSARDTAAVLEV